ncbi:hypothetical protein H6G11_09720 [Cyanobacterium aponinum FACHB-4101]|uniref:BRO-N domain-containing protein n=1 Tax=Cyanobacterium aponinum TaxID=379064 RepID=UPI001681601A|nr:BRO family protein [Cyanobacterium aponinum]MBD2394527.1 hypothetical protein [Cyanobacterium aponinum FACHB-4101]
MSLTVFEFQDYPVRFVGTSDRPEWIAKDVCMCLGLSNVSEAMNGLEDYDCGEIIIADVINRSKKHITVYETGLYALIFKSRKPEAKAFKRWIIEEVLPSIRKTGSYSVNSDYQNMSIDELKSELKRKKLLLEHIKLDNQLERLNKQKQSDSVISNIKLAKVYRLLKKKGEITSTDVKRFIWEFKSVPNGEINELLLSLVELGKAQQIPTKKGIRIKVM